MKARWLAVLAGIAIGATSAALLAIPAVRALEQQVGLAWLFRLRGPIEPPSDVVLVLMNRRAAENLSLPRDAERFHRCEDLRVGRPPPSHVSLPAMPSRWPRCLHAQLLDQLLVAGAKLVVFDVLFRERPPLPGSGGDLHAWQDESFAAAAARGAVLVAQKVETAGEQESLAILSPRISNAVLGSAPFPLVAEAGRRVDRFMAFKEEGLVSPTLPAIAVQTDAIDGYPQLRDFVARHATEMAPLLPTSVEDIIAQRQLQATSLLIRRTVRGDYALTAGLLAEARARTPSAKDDVKSDGLRRLAALYAGPGTRLLNLYGPPGTIPALEYDAVLAASRQANVERLRGRVIFVGFGETGLVEQVEHFSTVFSSDEHVDLSGVEIAATAFANLRDGRTLRELPFLQWLVLTFLAGFLAYFACDRLRNRLAIAVVLGAVAAYALVALHLFQSQQLWVPIVLPLAVAVPLGTLTAFGWKFWTAHQQRAQLRHAFSYFVPREVVAALERNAGEISTSQESLECACVATDAANFTPLAEGMTPEELTHFLNRYFEALFGRVADRGGFVSDVVGDAMLAIWPHRTADTHMLLLYSLLEMRDAAQQFNEQLAGNRLMTRFGVDWGRVSLSTVGAHGHYEYRAVGDAVNTATRIQELNKQLGTRILLSAAALGDAGDAFLLRGLGRFLLRGKSHPVQVFELVDRRATAIPRQVDLCARFEEARLVLGHGEAATARSQLKAIQEAFPEDGPTAFYLKCLEGGIASRDGAWVVS